MRLACEVCACGERTRFGIRRPDSASTPRYASGGLASSKCKPSYMKRTRTACTVPPRTWCTTGGIGPHKMRPGCPETETSPASGAPSPRWDRARRAEPFHVTWFTFWGGQIARGLTRSRRAIGAADLQPRPLPACAYHTRQTQRTRTREGVNVSPADSSNWIQGALNRDIDGGSRKASIATAPNYSIRVFKGSDSVSFLSGCSGRG